MVIASASDFRAAAKKRLPRFLFDYIDGGAYAELTCAPQRRGSRPRSRSASACCATSPNATCRTDPVRPQTGHAGRARAGRSRRHVCAARRGAGGARGRGEGRAVQPLQPLGLRSARSGGGERRADLVPALHHQGPRLHGRAARRRPGGRLRRPAVHRRPAHARRALPRPPFRHVRPRMRAGAASARR